jgi:hypothetical protein
LFASRAAHRCTMPIRHLMDDLPWPRDVAADGAIS